jgi:hypothetical protein
MALASTPSTFSGPPYLAAALAIAVVYQTAKRQRLRARVLADHAAHSGGHM